MSYSQDPYPAYQEPLPANRPGCITAYAILMWFGAGFYILGALFFGLFGFADFGEYGASATGAFLLGALCIGAMSAIPILLGWGLWTMKKWAWWLVVIFQSLGVLGALANLCTVFTTDDTTMIVSAVCGAVVGGAISGLILYWFIQNRHLFNGVVTYQTVAGPDGAPIRQPVVQSSGMSAGAIALVVGVLLVVVLVPICVIVILALLGPAIGDVFSEIMLGI